MQIHEKKNEKHGRTDRQIDKCQNEYSILFINITIYKWFIKLLYWLILFLFRSHDNDSTNNMA